MNRFRKNHLTYYLSPLVFLFLLAAAWQFWLKPLALVFIKSQIPQINSSQNLIKLHVDEIDLSLLRLQLLARGVQIELLDPSTGLEPVRLKSVTAQIDLFNLIIGQVNIAKLTLSGGSIKATVDLHKQSDQPLHIPVEEIFKWAQLVPADRLILQELQLELNLKGQNSQLRAAIPLLTLQNRRSFLMLNLTESQIEFQDQLESPLTAKLEFSAQLNPKLLSLTQLRLRSFDTDISAQAQFSDVKNLLVTPRGELDYRARLNLESLRTATLILFPQKNRTPSATGIVESTGSLRLQGVEQVTGQ